MATQCLALALAPEIRVNAVAPGILESPGAPETLKQRVPAGRFGALAEVVGDGGFPAGGQPVHDGRGRSASTAGAGWPDACL